MYSLIYDNYIQEWIIVETNSPNKEPLFQGSLPEACVYYAERLGAAA